MPPGKRRQSNAMLYTLVTFVALFVVATTVAVIYYVRAEDLRTKNKDAETKLKEMASADEIRRIGEIVGEKGSGKSYLGTMADYMDQLVGIVTGPPIPATTAQVKVTKDVPRIMGPLIAQAQAQPLVGLPAAKPVEAKPADANAADPNKPAEAEATATATAAAEPNLPPLAAVVSGLLNALKQTTSERDALQVSLKKSQDDFNAKTEEWAKTKGTLNASVEKYRLELEKAKTDYNELTVQLNTAGKELKDGLAKTLKDEQTKNQQLTDELSKTKNELAMALVRLADTQTEISKIQPSPDRHGGRPEPGRESHPSGSGRRNRSHQPRIRRQGLSRPDLLGV